MGCGKESRIFHESLEREYTHNRIKPLRIEILFSPLSGIANEVVGERS